MRGVASELLALRLSGMRLRYVPVRVGRRRSASMAWYMRAPAGYKHYDVKRLTIAVARYTTID